MSPQRFPASWLALREGVDHRSRASALLEPLQAWWARRGAHTVLDLGAGAGSNLRYLAPKLPGSQAWTLADHDEALLSLVGPTVAEARVTTVCADLTAGDLASLGLGPSERLDLVTASALLDLVSETWLTIVVDACVRAQAAALFALSYDGYVAWSGDADPMDVRVLDAVNRHQRGDKGFGPALGPVAGATAEAAFRAAGYRTWRAPSPWLLDAADGELVGALTAGWAAAAAELLPEEEVRLRAWADRRAEDVTAGRARLTVGHQDVLALPAEASAP